MRIIRYYCLNIQIPRKFVETHPRARRWLLIGQYQVFTERNLGRQAPEGGDSGRRNRNRLSTSFDDYARVDCRARRRASPTIRRTNQIHE